MDREKFTPVENFTPKVEKIRRSEKIKRFRCAVVKLFLMLFIPQFFACILVPLFTKNLGYVYAFQFIYFSIYSICSGFFYILAPKLINKF